MSSSPQAREHRLHGAASIDATGRRLPAALVLWTLFVWGSRIRNIVGDDDLTGGGRTFRIAVAVAFIAGALAVGWALLRSPRSLGPLVAGFAVWTTGYWLVRGVGILVDEHGAAFKAVHTVLALISIGLAIACWRRVRFVAPIGRQ